MNVEFRTVSMDQNILPFLEDHGGSAGSGCFHREHFLWIGCDVQGLPQRGAQMSASAVNQTDLCIATALCHPLAHTVSQLHAVLSAWNSSSNLLNLARSVMICEVAPAVDHQAPRADTCWALAHLEDVLFVLVLCLPRDFAWSSRSLHRFLFLHLKHASSAAALSAPWSPALAGLPLCCYCIWSFITLSPVAATHISSVSS